MAGDPRQIRVGIDVGGTFTDLVVVDGSGNISTFKVPSTPKDPSVGVFEALKRGASSFGLELEEFLSLCTSFIHGTTVGTNAMVERNGAKVGLVCTEGFRDTLAIRRGKRDHVWDYRKPYAPEIVPRCLRLPIRERIDKNGVILVPLDEDDVKSAIKQFEKQEVESIAVCLFNAFLNDAHEQEVKTILQRELPSTFVSLSTETLPVMGEYERLSTTVANAYIGPKTIDYLVKLEGDLKAKGFRSKLLVMQSNGGILSLEYCSRKPILTVLSGPAAGAPAALLFARCVARKNVIAFDMGGTSCDVILIKEGRPAMTDELRIAGYDVAIPSVDIRTIGTGGGTVAFVDAGGMLRVGPRSAGADPGPACYAQGGTEPTVTDANVVLGRLNPLNFLGGEIKLREDLAKKAIEEKIANPLGMDLSEAAMGIVRIANENMVNAIEMISVQKGHDPRKFCLIAAGGAGALHASALAGALRISEVYIPRQAAVYCSMGMLQSDIRHDHKQTYFHSLSNLDVDELNQKFADMKKQAEADVISEGFAAEDIVCDVSVDLRYRGQQWEVEVPMDLPLRPQSLRKLEKDFHTRHESLYGHKDLEGEIEMINMRLVTTVETPDIGLTQCSPPVNATSPKPREIRPVCFEANNDRVSTPIYDGPSLESGDIVRGPALIEEPTTTILVDVQDQVYVDRYENYLLTKSEIEEG